MRLAEGTPPADGAQAFARVGHCWRDFQPFTSLWQPEPASCSVHQPAHARIISQPVMKLPCSRHGMHNFHAQGGCLSARCQALDAEPVLRDHPYMVSFQQQC